MRGTTEQDRIEELARLLDGELPHDEASASLRSLAQLAETLHDEIALERPDPAFRAALRAEVVAAATAAPLPLLARVRDAIWERTARLRHSAKVATATATASMMIGSAGVAAAAQSALPGEALYGVKDATESLRFAFASGSEEVGRLHLALATERLDEVVTGFERLTPSQVIDTLGRMDASSEAGAEELLRAFREDPAVRILEELQGFSARQRSVLTGVVDRLPLEAKPFAEESLELLRRIDVALESSAAGCDCAGAAGLGGTTTAGVTGVGQGPAACECTGASLPLPRSRERRGGGTVTDGGVDGVDGVGTIGGQLTGTDGRDGGSSGTGGGRQQTGGGLDLPSEIDTSGLDGGPIDDVDQTTDPIDETADDAADTVTDTVSEVTGTASEIVDDAASEVPGVGDVLP